MPQQADFPRQLTSSMAAHPRLLRLEHLEDRRMLAGRAAEAINLFALDVYEHMQREEGNLFFSPLSVATGLAMAYAGAAGQTAAEMEQVLHLGSAPGIHTSFGELLDSIKSNNESFALHPKRPHVLTVANAIWPDNDLAVQPGFLDVVQGAYDGHVQNVDYDAPLLAEEIINDWVSDHTEGNIPNLVSDLTPLIRMVLTNAVYFNGYWDVPFDSSSTGPDSFTLPDGQTISVPTMYTIREAAFTNLDGFSVLELPFAGGAKDADYSMVLVLPPESGAGDVTPETFAQIETWLDGPQFESYVQIKLPKVDTAVSTTLQQLLVGLGMPTAFDLGAADFSAMTPEGVAISKVFHKATLTMNEQGTRAAAATEIDFPICFAAGTPVMTSEGFKPIDEIKPGDLVLARDENNVEGGLLPKRVEIVHHHEGELGELRLSGQIIRATGAHPFFVKGKGWTPASELRPGDLLSTSIGGWIEVDGVEFTKKLEPVYNLRIAEFHTYFVGRKEWGFAIWAHNSCIEPEFFADRPFHLLIRDNITSTIAFMGRIDDPTQLSNDVTPVVVDANADFDENQQVDGADFLAWQRGFGAANPTLADGDSNMDGDVDANDLGEWKQAFGQVSSTPMAAAVLSESPPDASAKASNALSSSSQLDLIDAAMALEWLASDGNDEEPLLIDDPAQLLQQAARASVDNDSIPAVAAAAAFDLLELTSVDELPALTGELDDDLLAIQLE